MNVEFSGEEAIRDSAVSHKFGGVCKLREKMSSTVVQIASIGKLERLACVERRKRSDDGKVATWLRALQCMDINVRHLVVHGWFGDRSGLLDDAMQC